MLCPVQSTVKSFCALKRKSHKKDKHRNYNMYSHCGYRIACHWKESSAIKFQVTSSATYLDRKIKRKLYLQCFLITAFWSLFLCCLIWESCLQKLYLFLEKKIDARFFSYNRVSSARSFKSTEDKYCTSFQNIPHSKNLASQSFTYIIEETVN